MVEQQRLSELAQVFLRLGLIAFGGPAAHIAMMDDEVVQRRQWMSREKLLDLIGITNLLPGPNSTELAIHIGYERAGWLGLWVAGACFILPAMAIVWLLAALYVRFQTLPQLSGLLYGIKPVIIAIVLQALWKLGQKAGKDWPTRLAGLFAVLGYLAGYNELLVLIIMATVVMWVQTRNKPHQSLTALLVPGAGLLSTAPNLTTPLATAVSQSMGWPSVFLFFLKVGSVLFGSGYVLLAFLQRDLVERQHWLSSQQLLDAVAIGQLTPGPVFTTATFIGYLVAGNAGAIAGTVGIFLPAFLLVGLVSPWVSKLRQSPWASSFLDGLNAASWGLMAGVTYTLARTAIVDWVTLVTAILSLILVWRFKINSAWLVLAGATIGLAYRH